MLLTPIKLSVVPWDKLKVGDIVYERGTMFKSRILHAYADCLYGPFQVTDIKQRELRNIAGKSFKYYPNNLYKMEV